MTTQRDGSDVVWTVPPETINVDSEYLESYGELRDRDVILYGYSLTEVNGLSYLTSAQRSDSLNVRYNRLCDECKVARQREIEERRRYGWPKERFEIIQEYLDRHPEYVSHPQVVQRMSQLCRDRQAAQTGPRWDDYGDTRRYYNNDRDDRDDGDDANSTASSRNQGSRNQHQGSRSGSSGQGVSSAPQKKQQSNAGSGRTSGRQAGHSTDDLTPPMSAKSVKVWADPVKASEATNLHSHMQSASNKSVTAVEIAVDVDSEKPASLRTEQNVAEIYAKALGASLAESNRILFENMCANTKMNNEAMQAVIAASTQNNRKGISQGIQAKDVTLLLHQPGDGPHMSGLNQLPSNHSNTKAVTDLNALSKFTGMNVIVEVLNEVFDFCIARMINHQSLLSLIQGLHMFSEGMKDRVRDLFANIEISQFMNPTDPEDQAQSLATTRMLVSTIRILCLEFYVKAQESVIDVIKRMNAASYSSVGFSGEFSFVHFDNVLPCITRRLVTAEPHLRTPERILELVEGTIKRSGRLWKEYLTLKQSYRPEWNSLEPLERYKAVITVLATSEREQLIIDGQAMHPPRELHQYIPPPNTTSLVYTSFIRPVVRSQGHADQSYSDRAGTKGRQRETIKSNLGHVYERDRSVSPGNASNLIEEEDPSYDEYTSFCNYAVDSLTQQAQRELDAPSAHSSRELCTFCGNFHENQGKPHQIQESPRTN